MSKSGDPDRRRKRPTGAPAAAPKEPDSKDDPKLARGTRDITSLGSEKLARGTRDALPMRVVEGRDLDIDIDTLVVDPTEELDTPDPEGPELLAAEGDPEQDVPEVPEVPEVPDSADAVVDARMLELGQRRFGISQFRPGQALAIRNV